MSDLILVVVVVGIIAAFFVFVMVHARRVVPYIYSSATISAWEARLLSEASLFEFVNSARVVNVLAGLDDTDYGSYLSEIPRVESVDVVTVERGLKRNLYERYQELLKLVPKERKETIVKVIGRIDVQNLRTLLTAIHNKVPKDKRVEEMVPSPTFSSERINLLASAGDLNELLEYLRETEYFDVLSAAMEDYEERGLIALLSALDKHYYSSLWADVTSKKAQRKILKAVVGYELDAVNIKLILRLKLEGAPADEITKHVILPSHELTEGMVKEMVAAEGVRQAVEAIWGTNYGQTLHEALPEVETTGSLLPIERALDEGLLKVCKWAAITSLFSIGPVLSHIYLREAEVRNLHAIIKLKADGVEPEKIKETLVKVPKIEL